jgi:hypothetical protein
VEEEAVPGRERREIAALDLAEPADRGGPHADQVHRKRLAGPLEDVPPEPAAAGRHVVDDDESALQAPRPAHTGVDDAVLDHAYRRATVVPHQRVERGHVDEKDVGVVHRMAGLRGVRPGWIVLDIDAWSSELGLRQDPWAVLPPVLVALVQHEVDVEAGDVLLRDLMDAVRGPRPAADPALSAAVAVDDRQEEFMTGPDQRIEIAPVDVPREDPE